MTRMLPCPGVELFLDSSEDLYLLPIQGREQLRIEAPWGRWTCAALRGDPLEAMPVELADEVGRILDWLASERYIRPAEALGSADTSQWDRQVRWLAQETGDGPTRQRRLRDARVLVLGVGGLGCVVADLLARAGVGTLILVDDDHVELGNLPRQPLYVASDVGEQKVDVAGRRIRAAIPSIRIERSRRSINGARDMSELLDEHHPMLVVCSADRPPIAIKSWVEDAAAEHGVAVMHGGHRPPLVYAGPFFVPGLTPCYECFARSRVAPGTEQLERELSACRDRECPELPAVGWGDTAAASMIVAQCVNWLAGVADPVLVGRELEFDLSTLRSRFVEGPATRSCARCESLRAAA